MTTPLTGDSNNRETRDIKPMALFVAQISTLEVTRLADAEDTLNQAARSGKKRGAMLALAKDGSPTTLLVAAGSGNTDPWYNVVDGATFATPS